jgi:hypothetical protein
MNQATGRYLHGCGGIAMAHTPRQALVALHRTQIGLLAHSAHALAQVNELWRKQGTELLVMRAEHAPRQAKWKPGWAHDDRARPDGPVPAGASGKRQRHAG